jgi:hypothetical protein
MGGDALRYALVIVALINLWSGFHYWRASRTVRANIAEARAEA